MWLHSADYYSCPQDVGAIAVIMAEPCERIASALKEICNPYMPLLKERKDEYISLGLKKEADKQRQTRKKNSDNAKRRWHKDLDAMPPHKKTMRPQCQNDAKSMPKACSPSPTPSPIPSPVFKSTPQPPKGGKSAPAVIPEELLQQQGFAHEFGEYLKTRKTKATTRAQELVLTELRKRPSDAVEALQIAILRGWTGIKWDWVDNHRGTGKPKHDNFLDVTNA